MSFVSSAWLPSPVTGWTRVKPRTRRAALAVWLHRVTYQSTGFRWSMRGGILAPRIGSRVVSSCVARPRPGSLGARRSFVRRWCPRPPSTPSYHAQPASLGVKSSGWAVRRRGRSWGEPPRCLGSFEGRARGWQEVLHLCGRLTSDTRWISICDIRDLPPDIRNSKQHPSEVKTARSLPKSRTSANCQWGDV